MAMRRFCSQADRLAQSWMRMNSLTNINSISAHLNCQANFTNQIASMRAYNAATDNAMGRCIKDEFCETFIATISNRTSASSPWE